jgi:hypothetical protein
MRSRASCSESIGRSLMHKTLTSVVALAGLAAAGAVQAEDAVVAGDSVEPIDLSLSQMDEVTAAGDRVCVVCANAARAAEPGRPVPDRSYKSYDSIGEWFADLRSSWFGGRSKRSDDEIATTRSSTTQTIESSESNGHQVNRVTVTQEKSSTATATDGGSAVARVRNDSAIEQKN